MNLDLSGRRALVTGSSAGIGFAIASGLARSGAAVWINGRDVTAVQRVVAELRACDSGLQILGGIAADVTSVEGAKAVFAVADAVDILVNNVGTGKPAPFEQSTDDDWRSMFDINVLSGVRMTRHYLPGMRARDWGRVVFVASESGVQIPPENIHYGVSKAAQIATSRGIAETVKGSRVTVNSILPGPTKSGGLKRLLAEKEAAGESIDAFTKAFLAERRPTHLQQRFSDPDEIANLAVFLCSEASSAIHGAALRVDGGILKGFL